MKHRPCGTVRESVFDNEYGYGEQIIKGYEGKSEIKDETILPIIYELDNVDEWQNEESWYKANPALATIKKLTEVREKVQRAINNPTELSNLLCKDFNIRMTENSKWLSYEIASNEATFEMEQIYDTYAIGGVDLSSTTDLTCATCLVVKGGIKYVLQQYFIPGQYLERRIKDDKIPYDIWNARGFVTICEGSKVNYTDVTEWFQKLQNEFEISTIFIGYDPWNSNYWIDEMKTQRIRNDRGSTTEQKQ